LWREGSSLGCEARHRIRAGGRRRRDVGGEVDDDGEVFVDGVEAVRTKVTEAGWKEEGDGRECERAENTGTDRTKKKSRELGKE